MGKGDLGLGGSRAMGQGEDAVVVVLVIIITEADFDDFDAVYLGRGLLAMRSLSSASIMCISKLLPLASVILPLRRVQGP